MCVFIDLHCQRFIHRLIQAYTVLTLYIDLHWHHFKTLDELPCEQQEMQRKFPSLALKLSVSSCTCIVMFI